MTSWLRVVGMLALSGCVIENGLLAAQGIDRFRQVPTDEVDILFVVDDSRSMQQEQEALAAGFDAFVRALAEADNDFHVGVVSTDQDRDDAGALVGDPPFLTRDDDVVAEFGDRARLGTRGADKEMGLQAAVLALSPQLQVRENLGFLRDGANLLVVVVSDEDDCSDFGALQGQEAAACYAERGELVPVEELVDRIVGLRPEGTRVQISAIVGPQDRSCGDEALIGRRYIEAAELTDGTVRRICEPDWGTILEEVGLAALGLQERFRLEEPAIEGTLVVRVNGVEVAEDPDNGWTYDAERRVLTFHGAAIPARGAEIVVTYDVAPNTGTVSAE